MTPNNPPIWNFIQNYSVMYSSALEHKTSFSGVV